MKRNQINISYTTQVSVKQRQQHTSDHKAIVDEAYNSKYMKLCSQRVQ